MILSQVVSKLRNYDSKLNQVTIPIINNKTTLKSFKTGVLLSFVLKKTFELRYAFPPSCKHMRARLIISRTALLIIIWSRLTWSISRIILCLRSSTLAGGLTKTLLFTYPQRKKSQGVRSGDRGGHSGLWWKAMIWFGKKSASQARISSAVCASCAHHNLAKWIDQRIILRILEKLSREHACVYKKEEGISNVFLRTNDSNTPVLKDFKDVLLLIIGIVTWFNFES